MTIELVNTALLNRWEIADVGKDGMVNKHIKEITSLQMEAIMLHFLKNKIVEMENGFRLDLKNGYELNVTKIKE